MMTGNTTATSTTLAEYVRAQVRPGLSAVGGFSGMCVLTGKALFRRPFQWREFILQGWFLCRVSFLSTVAVAIPLTVLIIFTLNMLLAEFGAAGPAGVTFSLDNSTDIGDDGWKQMLAPAE